MEGGTVDEDSSPGDPRGTFEPLGEINVDRAPGRTVDLRGSDRKAVIAPTVPSALRETDEQRLRKRVNANLRSVFG